MVNNRNVRLPVIIRTACFLVFGLWTPDFLGFSMKRLFAILAGPQTCLPSNVFVARSCQNPNPAMKSFHWKPQNLRLHPSQLALLDEWKQISFENFQQIFKSLESSLLKTFRWKKSTLPWSLQASPSELWTRTSGVTNLAIKSHP